MTREEIIEAIGDPEQFQRDMRAFQRSMDYVAEHWDEIYGRFVSEWIAVYDGALVARASSHEDLLEALDKMGIPRQHTLTEFVFPDEVAIMLPCR